MTHTTASPAGMVLYTGPLSMFGMKAEIAMREKDMDFERVSVPYDPSAGYAPKHPEVVRINPKRQVPVLVHGRLELFDSTQIFEYLEDVQPDPPLWPRTVESRARARRLEHMSDEIYFPHIIHLMGLQDALDGPAARSAIDAATDYYGQMDALLMDGPFLAGDCSFADIAFYMASLFGERMGARMPEATPRLHDWRARMTRRPAVRTVVAPLVRYLRGLGRPVPDFLPDDDTEEAGE